MTALTGSLAATDPASRSRAGRMIALLAAVLTPLVLAGASLLSIADHTSTASAGAPALPAAIVNLDAPITTTINGASTPVAAGKLLTTQLSQNGGGFTWTLTDASAANDGLLAGTYAAVVTVPSNFSAAYISSSGVSPVQAALSVQTNGAANYVVQQLASALSSGIQTSLSSSLTANFVKGLLVGFTELHTQLGQAANGAQQLAQGTNTFVGYLQDAANGSVALGSGAGELASGLGTLAAGVDELPAVTRDLAAGGRLNADGVALLNRGIDDLLALQIDIDAKQLGADLSLTGLIDLIRDDPSLTKEEIMDLLSDIQQQTRAVQGLSADMSAGLLIADVGTDVLRETSALIASGSEELAAAMPDLAAGADAAATGASQLAAGTSELVTGLQGLATGGGTLAGSTSQLANGLTQAAGAIPTYTDAQQQTLSSVVAAPITTTVGDLASSPNPRTALASIAIPVALWLGALALFLVLIPVLPESLASSASSWRVTARSFLPAAGLALVQALLVVVCAVVLGFRPEHHLAAVAVILVMSLAFVLLHHGLVSAFGRIGRVLSLAFLAAQVLAAGLIIPFGLAGSWLSAMGALLPLTQAIRGLQVAATGGDLGTVLAALLALAVVGLVGVFLSVVSTARRRSLVGGLV